MDRIVRIEKDIQIIVMMLDEWQKVQKSWMYLEPVFGQEDIAQQMPIEAEKFAVLNQQYRREALIMKQIPLVLKQARRENIVVVLTQMNADFESITKGLSIYLESKREHFARFYFLSNEDIIEILASISEPRNVQKFLNKIFEGIDYLNFTPQNAITAFFSKEGESMMVQNNILTLGSPEVWLK